MSHPSIANGKSDPGSSPVIELVMLTLIGVVFGLFPAIRAARLDPATALRHE